MTLSCVTSSAKLDSSVEPIGSEWSVQFRSSPCGPSANSCISVPIGQPPNLTCGKSACATTHSGTGIVTCRLMP